MPAAATARRRAVAATARLRHCAAVTHPWHPPAPKHLRFRLSLPSCRKAASSSLLKVARRRSAAASSIGFVAPVSTTRLGHSTSSRQRASTDIHDNETWSGEPTHDTKCQRYRALPKPHVRGRMGQGGSFQVHRDAPASPAELRAEFNRPGHASACRHPLSLLHIHSSWSQRRPALQPAPHPAAFPRAPREALQSTAALLEHPTPQAVAQDSQRQSSGRQQGVNRRAARLELVQRVTRHTSRRQAQCRRRLTSTC